MVKMIKTQVMLCILLSVYYIRKRSTCSIVNSSWLAGMTLHNWNSPLGILLLGRAEQHLSILNEEAQNNHHPLVNHSKDKQCQEESRIEKRGQVADSHHIYLRLSKEHPQPGTTVQGVQVRTGVHNAGTSS
jgi:hypothetical protein